MFPLVIRKYFNLPSDTEAKLIAEGCDKVHAIVEADKQEKNKSQESSRKYNDDKCPHCGGKVIINKIARVIGKGEVSGSFVFGSGGLYGSSSVDTTSVNHCKSCGNEWKKYEVHFYWTDEILAEQFNGISSYMDDRVGENKYAYKIVDKLIGVYAESLWHLWISQVRSSSYCYYSTKSNITLGSLRKIFKSVYTAV